MRSQRYFTVYVLYILHGEIDLFDSSQRYCTRSQKQIGGRTSVPELSYIKHNDQSLAALVVAE